MTRKAKLKAPLDCSGVKLKVTDLVESTPDYDDKPHYGECHQDRTHLSRQRKAPGRLLRSSGEPEPCLAFVVTPVEACSLGSGAPASSGRRCLSGPGGT